ncbi:MAG: hypothetical protein VKN33_03650 [Candidatus Sericytochromatia bacterium]|nr:hypothetical protein [Candidatus Sericytochromatia bacterium]
MKSRASEPGDNYVADSDARAARVAAQRLERLIGRPRNATLPFLLEAARALPTPSDRRAWLEAALYDHDLRASHVDAPTARMMIARLTLAGIESQMEKPDARTLLGRIQAMQAAHDLAEHAFEAIVEPETRSLANFANEAQKMLNTPAASLALIQDALTHLTTLPEESPVEVSAAIATMAMTHMNQAGRTPSEQEALGMAALRTITDLRGTPLLQTRLMEAEREADLKKRIARIRTALQAEA